PDITVTQSGFMLEGSWKWSLNWSVVLSHVNVVATDELLLLLTGVAPFFDRVDNKRWMSDQFNKISVSPTYQFL
ncbi:hypothetical protein A2U01_0012753, partial [Trifolium medium]|nr:hypothetical protein [Trifolium medium]